MKIIASTVLVALFASTQARFLDASSSAQPVSATYGVTFSSTLNCGACIGGGYTYCINKAENTTANTYVTGSTGQVCYNPSSAAGANEALAAWSCSTAFNDRVYSKYVCQFNTAACGTNQAFTLNNIGSTASFNITNLALGQTCFYKVQALCGAPAFKPTDTSRVEVEYVEFREGEINTTATVVGYNSQTSVSSAKRTAAPAVGLPRRDHIFRSELGGNNIANGNITTT